MSIKKLQGDFELLREHCIIIRRNYNTYQNLFFSDNNDLLLKTACSFFNDIAEIMHRDWILQVCKLMDPATSKSKSYWVENISLKLINSQLLTNELLSQEIITVSNQLIDYGSKLTPARHKRLAHFDREQHMNEVNLGETTKNELASFLVNIQQYCDLVGDAIKIGPLDFSTSSHPGDELDLISILQKAVR